MNRRAFLSCLPLFALTFLYDDRAVHAETNQPWFSEVTSTIRGAISFVSDIRKALKEQGLAIDRDKLRPYVSTLNVRTNGLLNAFRSTQHCLGPQSFQRARLQQNAHNLSPAANTLLLSMESLFAHISPFDSKLMVHKNAIYDIAQDKSEIVKTITAQLALAGNGKLDEKLLTAELQKGIDLSLNLRKEILGLLQDMD